MRCESMPPRESRQQAAFYRAMSTPLTQEGRSESALVAFTLLVPASAGVALFALAFGGGVRPAIAALALAGVGMAGSITHLAKPLRAPTSLRNIRSSWLSREITAVSVFWAFELAWLASEAATAAARGSALGFFADAAPAASLLFRAATVSGGALLLVVIARAYKVSTRPAWCGPECLMELFACALGAGSALYAASTGCSLVEPGVAATVSVIAGVAGLALDVSSHRRRHLRLENLREQSDERIPLTLARYDELRSSIHMAWLIEIAAVALAVATLFWVASLAQLVAHALHRQVFYKLPVQVRYTARLRK